MRTAKDIYNVYMARCENSIQFYSKNQTRLPCIYLKGAYYSNNNKKKKKKKKNYRWRLYIIKHHRSSLHKQENMTH